MASPFTITDPIKLAKLLWPKLKLSIEQQLIIYSVWDNVETYVAAANGMGKDFVAGLIIVLFFLTRPPCDKDGVGGCRIITTSAKSDHLEVLWGEINTFIRSSAYPLTVDKGGPLLINDQHIRKVVNTKTGELCPKSYIMGMVASEASEAALQGHWIANVGDGVPRTLFVADECSSVPHRYYKMIQTWSNRRLMFGNTWPCENFFKWAFEGKPGSQDKGGDLPRANSKLPGLFRKCFRMDVEMSPNVRFAREQIAQGIEPTDEIIVPGIKPWSEYQQDLVTLDPEEIEVKLFARWYKGKELRLFPGQWLDHAAHLADLIRGKFIRRAKAGGCDPGEGNANTAFVAGDEYGVIECLSLKTPDTNDIFPEAIAFIEKHNIPPERFCIDRGGGGKQLADRLRAHGYNVRTIAFGEGIAPMPQRMRHPTKDRIDDREERYTYINRRAQLYGDLSEMLDPQGWWWLPLSCIDNPTKDDKLMNGREMSGFAIPGHYKKFREQLEPIPKKRDGEGRLVLPPKNKKDATSKEVTLVDLIGYSPDEADALVLMVHGMIHPLKKVMASAG